MIPDGFKDDGCTKWFDKLFGYDLSDLCRAHDYAYCTRCHPPGCMTYGAKIRADLELSKGMKARLPWWLDWTSGAVYRSVYLFGPFNAFDSCGPEAGERCRHNMPRPDWMPAEPLRFMAYGGADM